MQKQDLLHLKLSTPVYHPFLGKGLPTKITEDYVDVKFREGVQLTFSTSYQTEKCTGLEHIFLNPVKVVEQ